MDEIKEKLFDYYRLNDIEVENLRNVNETNGGNNKSRKFIIGKNIKKLVSDILADLKKEKTDFIIFDEIRKIDKIFLEK